MATVFNTRDKGPEIVKKLNEFASELEGGIADVEQAVIDAQQSASDAEQSKIDAEGFKNQAEVAATNAANDVRSELEDVRDETEGFRDETAQYKADFELAFGGLSYLAPVEYDAGINIDSAVKTVEYDGEVYAPLPSEVPFITSGTFESDKFRLILGVTTQQMESTAAGGFAANIGRNVIAVDSIADLLALPEGARRGDLRYQVLSYHPPIYPSARFYGGGDIYWDSTSIETPNNGTIFQVPGVDPGRFKRRYDPSMGVDAYWFGAKGDGVHDDQPAFQAAMAVSRKVRAGEGEFFLGSPIAFDGGEPNGFNLQGGTILEGVSTSKTVFTRGWTDPSTRVAGATEAQYATEACLNVHGMYHELKNFTVRNAKIGVFMGQNLEQTDPTFVSRIKIDSVIAVNCGFGFLASVEAGITYSEFRNIHAFDCQVGFRARPGRFTSSSYFNRNKFYDCRFSRCRVGLWITKGDTNSFYSVDFEGITKTAGGGVVSAMPLPDDLPPVVPNGDNAVAWIFEDSPYNKIFGTTFESCETRIIDYNSSGNRTENQYIGLTGGESVSNPDYFVFTQPPAVWITERSFVNNWVSNGSSIYPNIDPDMESRGFGIKTNLYVNGSTVRYRQDMFERKAEPGTSETVDYYDLGAVAAGNSVSLPIPNEPNGRDSVEYLSFTITAVDATALTSLVARGEILIQKSTSNSNTSRAKLISPVRLNGYSAGGGNIESTTNDTIFTVTPSLASGTLSLVIANLGPGDFEMVSAKISRIRTRGLA